MADVIRLAVSGIESRAAVAWCDNALGIIDSLEGQAEKVPFRLPAEATGAMRDLVREWRLAADAGPDFDWADDFEPAEFHPLIVYWFNITKLSEGERERLGISFSPPEARPFADALAGAVAGAMTAAPDLAKLVDRLAVAWQDCQPAFAEAVNDVALAGD